MPKIKPIPEGMTAVTPHLVVAGAADAIEFYKKAFGAVEIFRNGGPDGKSIMHCQMRIGDSMEDHDALTLLISPLTGKVTVKSGAVSLVIPVDDKGASEREDKAGF